MSVADPQRTVPASLPLLAAAVLAAWAVVLAISSSPAAFYFSHRWEPTTVAGQLVAIGAYLASWTLMSTAMMLPTAARLLQDFATTVHARPARRRLELTVAAGFLTVWVVTGYVFRVGDIGVHAAVDSWTWLARHTRVIEGSTLVAAGLFQFSALKGRCLIACRSPRSFIFRHWAGMHASRDAYRVGFAYGRSCVGCCWALMLVMFGVGMSSLWLMLALTAAMLAEKNLGAGQRLARATGIALLAAGAAVLAA